LLPYFAFLLVTSLAAFFRRSAKAFEVAGAEERILSRRFLVVIPAHNEESNIACTVQSCIALRYPTSLFDVVVIADNCTDQTALRAREAKARVVERHDPSKKSKGHAIEFLIDALIKSGEFDTLDALVLVDADSTVHPELLEQFSSKLERGCDWIQCYDCVGNPDQTWRTRLMAYGFSLISGVTLLGLSALGLSAGLRGNGMCFSTNGLRRVPWRARGLVEDLEYSWTVRIAGERIDFTDDVAVYATMLAQGGSSSANQRRRWEFGRSALRRTMLVPLLKSPRLRWFPKTAAAIELTAPPITHLFLIYLPLLLISVVLVPDMLRYSEYGRLAFVGLSCTIMALALAVHAVSPFLLSFIPWRFALSLVYLPYYVFWKLIVLAGGRPEGWTRTPRENDPGVSARLPASSVPRLKT
jgi:cellulose synthase/poly-beta-1,6-N-acetylglucosamine synthase-like glycosyltransferase